jgi:hypothetical protein
LGVVIGCLLGMFPLLFIRTKEDEMEGSDKKRGAGRAAAKEEVAEATKS